MRDLKQLIADLQAILDGFKREGGVTINVEVAGRTLLTFKIPIPKE
jgi:hypothetical protein